MRTMPTPPLLGGAGQLNTLLGNPAFSAGLSLLGAGYDSRINPYQAALRGLYRASEAQAYAEERQRAEAEEQARIDAEQKAEAQRRTQQTVLGDLSERPDAYNPAKLMQYGFDHNQIKSLLGEASAGRKMYKGADGFNYWQDNPTERVNPGIVAQSRGGGIGQYNPRDYTTDSWSSFIETNNPASLVRYEAPDDIPSYIGQAALESATTADKAFMTANQYERLATDLISAAPNIDSGSKGAAIEYLKKVTGNQDFNTLLRKDYQSLRVSSAINNLPPGVASDKDIQLVMSSTLDTYAKPEIIASYLRGLSKASRVEGEYNQFRADYLYKNGNAQGMNAAWKQYAENNAASWGVFANTDKQPQQSIVPPADEVPEKYRKYIQ